MNSDALAPLTYSLPEAAARLGSAFTVDWLRSRLDEIPHGRTGSGRGRAGRIFFTEGHLAQIVERYTVRDEVAAPAPDPSEFDSIVSRRRRSVS